MKSDMLQLIFVCCDVRDPNYTYDTCFSSAVRGSHIQLSDMLGFLFGIYHCFFLMSVLKCVVSGEDLWNHTAFTLLLSNHIKFHSCDRCSLIGMC